MSDKEIQVDNYGNISIKFEGRMTGWLSSWAAGDIEKNVPFRECREEYARLIAAAPELLEALEGLIAASIEVSLEIHGSKPIAFQPAMTAARDAIAKAKGVAGWGVTNDF
jgi:hypothetical protein